MSTTNPMKIYCTGCQKEVEGRLTNGEEIYPHRPDLYIKKMIKCDGCQNYVGTHADGRPLGCIPTRELMNARMRVHSILDPLWKEGKIARGKAYAYISHRVGYTYHNGELRTVDEANKVYDIVTTLKSELK